MKIDYKVNAPVSVDQFIALLKNCSLGDRRPIDDRNCVQGMLENSNLCVSAWQKDQLIGVSRCVTDFHYCCYLSDLAVDENFQKFGVGKELQKLTQKQLGEKCTLILLAAPAAREYYPHIGYEKHDSCWVLTRENQITS